MLRFSLIFAVLLVLFPAVTFAEESDAACAARALRCAGDEVSTEETATLDWTGNGLIDVVDAESMLLSATDRLSGKAALQSALADSLLGEQFIDKFSYGKPTIGEYGSYRSDRISVNVDRVRTKIGDRRVVYYLADIYVRDLDCLRTAISEGDRSGTDPVFDMAQEHEAILAVSGDFYRARDRGLAVRNGKLLRASLDYNRDVCVIYRDGTMETFLAGHVDVDAIMDRGAWQAWCFGPALLDADGLPKTKFNTNVAKRNPRCAIGYYAPGHYCFLVVDGRQRSYSYGVSMEQLSELMYDLGCSVAYNLDGGATAVMATMNDVLNQRRNEDRECSDIVYIVDLPVAEKNG